MIIYKTTKDYVDDLCKLYPTIDKDDIKKIINFGWKSIYLLNSYGGDVVINTQKLWCYFGRLYTNSLLYFNYYIHKLRIKLRVLYKRRKIKWDGYYYFGLNDELYKLYLSQINLRGRKRKWFIFNNIKLFKLLDECKIYQHYDKYIFRVSLPVELNFIINKKELKTNSAELIITREPLKFKDILITNGNYELLNGTRDSE